MLKYYWALLPLILLDLYLNEISHPDGIEPGQIGEIFFPSSYIKDFKIQIWYSKSTEMFYVKCMSSVPSLYCVPCQNHCWMLAWISISENILIFAILVMVRKDVSWNRTWMGKLLIAHFGTALMRWRECNNFFALLLPLAVAGLLAPVALQVTAQMPR